MVAAANAVNTHICARGIDIGLILILVDEDVLIERLARERSALDVDVPARQTRGEAGNLFFQRIH